MRGIEYLNPKVKQKAEMLCELCNKQGIPLKITDTLRTKSEQDELYAQGRTKAGKIVTNVQYPYSAHSWGVAFDFCKNVKGKEFDDSDGFFKKVGEIGKSIGLTWGGDWKGFVDKPHLELTEYMPNSSVSWLQKTYGTPDNFKKTWIIEEVKPVKTEPEIQKWEKDGEEYLRIHKYITSQHNPKEIVTFGVLGTILSNYNKIHNVKE